MQDPTLESGTFTTSVVFTAGDATQAKEVKDALNFLVSQLGSEGVVSMTRLLPEMQGMMNDFGEDGIRELYAFSKKPASKIFLSKFRK